MKKTLKTAALAALCGTVLGGGCLGSGWWRNVLWGSAIYAGLEFVTDSDGVFDLFDDGDRDTDGDGVLDNDGDN